MPSRTARHRTPLRRAPRRLGARGLDPRPIPHGWLFAGAAAFAAAELAAGLMIGRFFAWGRAEALLFLAFRPWLLLAAALPAARFALRSRAAFYALALAAAGLAESLLLLGLGGTPWLGMLRGWAAGAMLALAIDLLLQLGRRTAGRTGLAAAAGLVVALLVVPGVPRAYEWVVLGPTGPRPADGKPELLLMTGLPIIWGEAGPFDPASRPAAAYRALAHEFTIRPIDYVDARSLAGGGLMLLAQPRALAPTELVALDAWVRGGGRILILTDPDLVWPTRLPPGDLRRPPPAGLLSPLLAHWRLRLEPSPQRRVTVDLLHDGRDRRRLALAAPGRFIAAGGPCRIAARDYFAFCRIGAGRALLLADADLLHDDLWAAPTPRGAERHARLADNPLIVGGWLDRLADRRRQRTARPVQWQSPQADRGRALLLAVLPILVALIGAAAAWRRQRR